MSEHGPAQVKHIVGQRLLSNGPSAICQGLLGALAHVSRLIGVPVRGLAEDPGFCLPVSVIRIFGLPARVLSVQFSGATRLTLRATASSHQQ